MATKTRRRLKVKLPPLTRAGVLATVEEIVDRIESAAAGVPDDGERPEEIARDVISEVGTLRQHVRDVESGRQQLDPEEIENAIGMVEERAMDLRSMADDLARAATVLDEQVTRAQALTKRLGREGSPWDEEARP